MTKKHKYDHRYDKHRQWLAERIMKVVLAFGYVLDLEYPHERVFIKRYADGRVVKVFTSISSSSSEIRMVGRDAIRVVTLVKDTETGAMSSFEDNFFHKCLYRKKVNRVGTLSAIVDRMVKAIKAAQAVKDWRGCMYKPADFHKGERQ